MREECATARKNHLAAMQLRSPCCNKEALVDRRLNLRCRQLSEMLAGDGAASATRQKHNTGDSYLGHRIRARAHPPLESQEHADACFSVPDAKPAALAGLSELRARGAVCRSLVVHNDVDPIALFLGLECRGVDQPPPLWQVFIDQHLYPPVIRCVVSKSASSSGWS